MQHTRHDPLSNCLSGSCWLLQLNGNVLTQFSQVAMDLIFFQGWNEIQFQPQNRLAWTDLNPCSTLTPLNIPPYCKGTIPT